LQVDKWPLPVEKLRANKEVELRVGRKSRKLAKRGRKAGKIEILWVGRAADQQIAGIWVEVGGPGYTGQVKKLTT
jgi:hypothetical protein